MRIKIVFLVVSFAIAFDVSSQENDIVDGQQECNENLSVFREYYKQDNYADAYEPWTWVFKNCPSSSRNIYKNGPKIIKERIKIDNENRLAYIDTLMLVFDQRIEFFGQEGYVLGLKGYELLAVDKSRSEEALVYLQRSIELEKMQSSVQAVYGYMRAVVNLEKSGLKSTLDVLDAYSIVSEIVEYNIVNESKLTNKFVKISQNIEDLFTPYANCDDLVSLYSNKVSDTTQDINLLKRISKLLKTKKCVDSDLFFHVSDRLYQLEPSSASADLMSSMSIAKRQFSTAIVYAKEAVELEEDPIKKAEYYLTLADAYRYSGSYSLARSAVYNALDLRSGWGEAYLILGDIYVASYGTCDQEFENKTIYWIAVDAFQRALADSESKAIASKKINTYSKYFPSTEECFFNGLSPNSQYTVECWINKSTIVRTRD